MRGTEGEQMPWYQRLVRMDGAWERTLTRTLALSRDASTVLGADPKRARDLVRPEELRRRRERQGRPNTGGVAVERPLRGSQSDSGTFQSMRKRPRRFDWLLVVDHRAMRREPEC